MQLCNAALLQFAILSSIVTASTVVHCRSHGAGNPRYSLARAFAFELLCYISSSPQLFRTLYAAPRRVAVEVWPWRASAFARPARPAGAACIVSAAPSVSGCACTARVSCQSLSQGGRIRHLASLSSLLPFSVSSSSLLVSSSF